MPRLFFARGGENSLVKCLFCAVYKIGDATSSKMCYVTCQFSSSETHTARSQKSWHSFAGRSLVLPGLVSCIALQLPSLLSVAVRDVIRMKQSDWSGDPLCSPHFMPDDVVLTCDIDNACRPCARRAQQMMSTTFTKKKKKKKKERIPFPGPIPNPNPNPNCNTKP